VGEIVGHCEGDLLLGENVGWLVRGEREGEDVEGNEVRGEFVGAAVIGHMVLGEWLGWAVWGDIEGHSVAGICDVGCRVLGLSVEGAKL